jgi:hypothetical protein
MLPGNSQGWAVLVATTHGEFPATCGRASRSDPSALALLNANHHPSTVNVANLESNDFRDPQPRGIATGQDDAVIASSYAG